jgi:hypothetical protein
MDNARLGIPKTTIHSVKESRHWSSGKLPFGENIFQSKTIVVNLFNSK